MARRIPIPLRDRLDDLRRGPLSVLVWCLAALTAGWLMLRHTGTSEYRGLARAREHVVAASTASALESLAVELYQDVERGEALALLDPSALEAKLQTAGAEIERLSAEVRAERARLELERGESASTRRLAERRLALDEEERFLEALELEVRLESGQIQLERVKLRQRRVTALVESKIISVDDLEDVTLLRDELEKEIEGNRELLAAIQTARTEADQRRERHREEPPPSTIDARQLEPLQRAVAVQEALVRELRLERERLVLRAPVAGRVSSVPSAPGATLAFGQPVVVLTERVPTEIVAYQLESDPRHLQAGDSAWIARLSEPTRRSEGLVVRLAPSVERLPERLWLDPNRPEYGRPFVIPVPDQLGLTPGERVGIWLDR